MKSITNVGFDHCHFILRSIAILPFFWFTSNAQTADWGDAPDPPFPTTPASLGAVHLPGPLFFGAGIDFEPGGINSFNAMGDDFTGSPDDEDGIIFSGYLLPGQQITLYITASMAGFVDAWIDFQGNGTWNDPGDQILNTYPVIAGINSVVVNVPANQPSLITYGRFRISATGGLGAQNLAALGEVEDYMIYIGNPPAGTTILDPDPGLSFIQNEISLTLEPLSGNLVAAYNDHPMPPCPGLGISYSTDMGATWTASQLALPWNNLANAPMADAFDPTITNDASGNVFAAYIATDFNYGNGAVNGIFVDKSSDGGITWIGPTAVNLQGPPANPVSDPNYRFNDRCQIIADRNPSSPGYNNVYLAWIQDRGWGAAQPLSDIYFSYSTDGGATFSFPSQVNNPVNGMGNMPIPTVDAAGNIYLLWMDYNVWTGGNGTMYMSVSTDGGQNWAQEWAVATIPLPAILLNNNEARAKGAAVLRAHPSNSGELYIVYAMDPDGAGLDEADIFFIASTDGGNSWTNPLRVNSDNTTSDQILPWMEVAPGGHIYLTWYDRRNDPVDLAWDVYTCVSTDGGASFQSETRLTTGSFQTPQTPFGFWLGEYPGLVATDARAYIAYTTSLTDLLGDVAFTSFNNPHVSVEEKMPFLAPNTLVLYPNPADGILYIEVPVLSSDWDCTLEMYDSGGKMVYSQTGMCEDLRSVDTRQFNQGVYLVRMVKDNGIFSGTVMIVR